MYLIESDHGVAPTATPAAIKVIQLVMNETIGH